MERRKTRTLTVLELEIMQVVWQHKEVTVDDIGRSFGETGSPLALPSIRTMLSILQEKGYVKRRPVGRTYFYRARVSAAQAQRRILKDVVSRAFDGSALNLVAALVHSGMVSARDIDEAKRLIAQRRKAGSK